MPDTDSFRRQHDDLLILTEEISTELDPRHLKKGAAEVAHLLAQLSGKLKVHLAAEDRILYPLLLESEDEQVVSRAQRYLDELGALGEAVAEFMASWNLPSAIQGDSERFVRDTECLLQALRERIERENEELLPPPG